MKIRTRWIFTIILCLLIAIPLAACDGSPAALKNGTGGVRMDRCQRQCYFGRNSQRERRRCRTECNRKLPSGIPDAAKRRKWYGMGGKGSVTLL